VRLDRFHFRPPNGDIPTHRLLFVGRQVECKGLHVLLQSLPGVVDVFPDVALVVIGDGDDFARNRELVRSLNLERHVEFRGAQPHREVARELERAQALVVPSNTSTAGEAEGNPVAPKEAFAAGVPVIATKCGGLPDVVPPEQRALLVPENDARGLTEAIVAFFEKPEMWHERATVARRWVEQQFDARRLVERVAEFYGDMRDAHTATRGR
jgi:glycosyltransferase involved in cell wall biosynthesis